MSYTDSFISDLNHVECFSEGFESIIKQYRSKGLVDYSGNEGYCIGVMKANGYNKGIEHGFENFITAGLKKLWETIKGMCRAIYEFFFGSKSGDDQCSPSEDVKVSAALEKKAENINKGIPDLITTPEDLDKFLGHVAEGREVKEPKNQVVRNAKEDEKKLNEMIMSKVGKEVETDKMLKKISPNGYKKATNEIKNVRARIANELREELNLKLIKEKAVAAFIKKAHPIVDKMADAHTQGNIEGKYKGKGGDWMELKRNFDHPNYSNFDRVVTDYYDEKKKELETLTKLLEDDVKEYEKAGEENVSKESQEELRHRQMYVKHLAEYLAVSEKFCKQVKEAYKKAFLNFESKVNKRASAELLDMIRLK